jgi:hypothetical protein
MAAERGRGAAEKVKGTVRRLVRKTVGKVPVVGRLVVGNSSPGGASRRTARPSVRVHAAAKGRANKARGAARKQHK